MIGALTLYRTTIGRKVIMAVTGLIGIGYVIGHMIGNLKVFFGMADFNEYAHGLREFGAPFFTHSEPLWIVRLVLLAAVVLHSWAAWTLYQDSRRARPVKYAKHTKIHVDLAALYIRLGGLILFIFVIFHLMHFTWGIPGVHPDFRPGDAYHNLVVGFQSYFFLPAIFYLIAMVVLAFHLYHGTWSLFQTLGLNNKNYSRTLRALSWFLAIVVPGGFSIVPLAVILGIVS
jgi:succinate dehydrogenase / fumarate reductase cytochrome b subunit